MIPSAILLLGPTGSGKTPLGELLQRRGLGHARCLHFDFGASLRQIVAGRWEGGPFSPGQLEFLRRVLHSAALLEDEHFPIAERILRDAMARGRADARTVVVLNGLPRHVGQAQAVDAILDVRALVHLHCAAGVVRERIGSNAGGDRRGRCDDDLAAVQKKLAVFAARTAPLIEHYRRRGVRTRTIEVTASMRPEEMWEQLESDATNGRFAFSCGN